MSRPKLSVLRILRSGEFLHYKRMTYLTEKEKND